MRPSPSGSGLTAPRSRRPRADRVQTCDLCRSPRERGLPFVRPCARAYLFDVSLVCSTENSSSQRVPKIGHGEESQLFRWRRMTAACEAGRVVKSTFNLVQGVVAVGKFSDLPNN